jgi:hypothetical protein
MARIIVTPFQIEPFDKILTEPIKNEFVEDASMVSQYVFRAKILYDRNYRGFQKDQVRGPKDAFETSGLPIMETDRLAREKALRDGRRGRTQDGSRTNNDYTFETPAARGNYNNEDINRNVRTLEDYITIVDYDYNNTRDRESRRYSSLTLPFIPKELNYDPQSKFVGIATMGRNNPYYHFTGSEDTLTFEIDWFSDTENRQDVITKCRWVEALTKANGYSDLPHRVKLVWGQDDKLFQDDIWIITSAPYVLSDMVKGFRREDKSVNRLGLMPQQAMQTITLKRLTINNRTSAEIIGNLNQ